MASNEPANPAPMITTFDIQKKDFNAENAKIAGTALLFSPRPPRSLRLRFQTIPENFNKAINIRERVIKRHRSYADHVRLAPVGKDAACRDPIVQALVRNADRKLTASLFRVSRRDY